MSSHHIVREFQEPAVYFESIEYDSFDLFADLLEWSPLVIANELTSGRLESLGIKVDEVISIPEGDDFGIAFVCEYLIDKGHTALNVVSTLSADKLRSEFGKIVLSLDELKVSLFNEESVSYYLKDGIFTKWYPSGVEVNIYGESDLSIRLSKDQVHEPTTYNLQSFVTADEGLVQIQSASGFWIEESIR